MRRFVKVFRDPIYGYIGVTPEELKVIELPLFQRLRRVSQLSFVNSVYPSANHTRFTHSLGVMHLARENGARLKDMGYIDDEKAKILRWAGLLHDTGHGPFSHAFEPVLAQFILQDRKTETLSEAHIRYGQKLIYENPEIYEKIGGQDIAKQVCALIRGKEYFGEEPHELLKSIMRGPFSIDRLDYLRRDAYHAGTPEYGIVDTTRIINSFLWEPRTEGVYYSKKGVYALEGAVLSYFNMYRAVYFHHATRAAYCLCQDILWEAFQQGIFDNVNWDDFWQNFDDFKCLEMIYSKGNAEIKGRISLLLNRKLPKKILDSTDLELRYDLKKPILRLCMPQTYEKKMELENEIRKNLGVKAFYIDSPNLAPYPPPRREEPYPVLIALDENQPSSANKPLHEMTRYLRGLWEENGIIRIYMEKIWSGDGVPQETKAKVLNTLTDNL